MRELIQKYQVLIVLLIVAFAWILWELRSVAVVLFAGYIIASALLPPIAYLEKRMPRLLAVIVVFIILIGFLALLILMAFQPMQSAFGNIAKVLQQSSGLVNGLRQFGIQPNDLFNSAGSNAVDAVSATAGAAADAFSALIVGIYLSYDWHRVRAWFSSFAPSPSIAGAVIDEQAHDLGAWTRGQLTLSAIVGVLVYVALSFAGIADAPALALLAASMEVVPYAGPILAAIPSVLLALETSTQLALLVIGIYIVIQQIESHMLVPLIMNRAVYIHPIAVIASVLAGFTLLGIGGALLAVPFTSLVWTTYKALKKQRAL